MTHATWLDVSLQHAVHTPSIPATLFDHHINANRDVIASIMRTPHTNRSDHRYMVACTCVCYLLHAYAPASIELITQALTAALLHTCFTITHVRAITVGHQHDLHANTTLLVFIFPPSIHDVRWICLRVAIPPLHSSHISTLSTHWPPAQRSAHPVPH